MTPPATEGGASIRRMAQRPGRSVRRERAGWVHGRSRPAVWRGGHAKCVSCHQQRQAGGIAWHRARVSGWAGRSGPQLHPGARGNEPQQGLGAARRARGAGGRKVAGAAGGAGRHSVAWTRRDAQYAYAGLLLREADIARASEVEHAVQYIDGDRHFGGAAPVRA